VEFDWLGNSKITVGDFVVDFKKTRILNQNEVIRIEPLAMELLCYLIARKGEYVSQRELLENVWNGRVVSDNAIRRVVKKLRDALGDDVKAAKYIKTVPNKGYLLIANVNVEHETIASTGEDSPTQLNNRRAQDFSITDKLKPTDTQVKPNNTHLKLFVLCIIVVAMFVVFMSVYLRSEPADKLVSIEPLTNMPGEEFWADYNQKTGAIVFSHRKSDSGYFDLYLKLPNSQTIKKLTNGEANHNAAKWSNSGKRLAYQRQKGVVVELMTLDFDANMKVVKSQSLFKYDTLQPTVLWSPDDLSLYFVHKQSKEHPYSLFSIDITTLDIKQLTFPDAESLGDYAAQFSPDGKYLAALRFRRYNRVHLMIFDMTSGKINSNHRINFAPINLSWDSEGERVYFTGKEELQYFDLPSKQFSSIAVAGRGLQSIFDTCGRGCLIASTSNENTRDIRELANPFNNDDNHPDILEFPFAGDEGHPDYTNTADALIFRTTINGVQQIVHYSVENGVQVLTNFEINHRLVDISYNPHKDMILGIIDQQVFTLDLADSSINYISQQMENAQRPSWTADGLGIYYTRREAGSNALIHYDVAAKKSSWVMRDILQAKEDKLGEYVYLLGSKGELHRKTSLLAQKQEFIATVPIDSNISWHVHENHLYYSAPKGKDFDLHSVNLNTGVKSVLPWQKNTYHARFKVHPSGQKFLLAQNNLPNSDLVYIKDSRLSN
jgi:transcriptional activator of cad operon